MSQFIADDLQDDNQTHYGNHKDSFSSVSSPFITNPEEISFTYDKDILDHDVLDTEGMDKSIADLQDSLANMKIKTASMKNLQRRQQEEDETMDSAKYDETQAQFDRDIDIDEKSEISRISKLSSRSKSSPISSTPWRQLRSSSSTSYNLPPIPNLKFDINLNSAGQDSSNTNVINELNKQLTGYKIQIKFFKQFLQKLIANKEDVDLSELNRIENMSNLSPMKGNGDYMRLERDFKALEREHQELNENYDEVFKLNEDLYLNIESFQHEIQQKERVINELNSEILTCHQLLNEILQKMMNLPESGISMKTFDEGLEIKLQVLKLELNKKTIHRLEEKNLNSRDLSRESFDAFKDSFSDSTKIPDKENEINHYIKTVHDLMTTLEQLKYDFNTQKELTTKIENELNFEIEKSSKIKNNYDLIKKNFELFSNKLNDKLNTKLSNNLQLENLTKQITALTKQVSTLTRENDQISIEKDTIVKDNARLNDTNTKLNTKFETYQKVIDDLQSEINDFKNLHNNSSYTELNEELLQSHKDFNNLQIEYNDLHDKYVQLKTDSSNTVSELTNQLKSKNDETTQMKSDYLVYRNLKTDLDLSVEKQRILKAENIRLSYKIESLTNDKIALQTTIQNLTDKVTTLTNSPSKSEEEINRRTNILEYQITELLQFDLLKFQRLMKSFNKIADDSSLKEPSRKITYMNNKLLPSNSSTDSNLSEIDFTDMSNIKEYHKSVFDYFIRAVDVIVNDHVKLLLSQNESEVKNSDYVNKLHKRIDELNKINDEISKSSIDTESEINDSISSPRSKLRIDELTNRWKAEREARVYENNEANKRLKELELENSRLREQLSS
ncbi:hypothetical protein CLIB1444_01S17898 [[Candida] jaroonii]|uniref:Uncharacterized protein n=1 Tax=[Candida] jaroonii TaxID=467808 RepID=A0ACA9Y1Y9_9ASCO|nr:hypothetical protein CLIB1444_01S17898 [[Candida] jaroonii]